MACIVGRMCILSQTLITVYDMTRVGHSIGKRVFLAWFGLGNALQLQLALLVGDIFMVSHRSSSRIDQLSEHWLACVP